MFLHPLLQLLDDFAERESASSGARRKLPDQLLQLTFPLHLVALDLFRRDERSSSLLRRQDSPNFHLPIGAHDGVRIDFEIDGRLVKSLVVGEPPVADDLLLPTSYEKTRLVGWIDPALRFEEWSVPIIADPEVPTKNP